MGGRIFRNYYKGHMDKKKKNIKTMKNKMAINTYLSTTESNKLSKHEQRQKHGCGENFDGCQMRGGVGEWVKR